MPDCGTITCTTASANTTGGGKVQFHTIFDEKIQVSFPRKPSAFYRLHSLATSRETAPARQVDHGVSAFYYLELCVIDTPSYRHESRVI